MKGSNDIEQTTQWAEKSGSTLTFEHVTWKSIGLNYSLRATLAPSLVLIKRGVKRYWADNTVGREEWFDLDLCTCDLKINRDLLLIGCNPFTKFGIDQVKVSKDIERTTQWAEKSGLTITFEHVTWKSIGIIYSLRATPALSLVLTKWRGQKILSRQHSGLRRVVWPWPLNMWPENQ